MPSLGLVTMLLCQSACVNNQSDYVRYEKIDFEQFQAMNDQVSNLHSQIMGTPVDDELSRNALPLVDSLNALIRDVRQVPDGLDFAGEIKSVDAVLFSSGRIDRMENSLIALMHISSKLDRPLPSLLIVKDYKAPDTLLPWRYILFYHVLKKDAIIRLQLVRNELQYLMIHR